jgi:HEAT repeat protein
MSTRLEDHLAELTAGDDERAEAAVAALAALPQSQWEDVLTALGEMSNDTEADTRWWGVRALAAVPAPGALRLLIRALGDEDAAVRQCAALGLRLHPATIPRAQQAIPALIAALDDRDHLCAQLSTDALVQIGEAAVPALLDVMENGSRTARLKAVRALAKIGDQRAIPALFTALDENSALMEYWASEGLERMGVGMVFFEPE